MIHCHGVTKRFKDRVAIDDVSFVVPSGICALIGPNGAGKSTLLKVLTTLLHPDAGEVRIAGLNISEQPLDVKRLIGVLPEDLGLFDSFTVEEHLALTGPIYGLTIPAFATASMALYGRRFRFGVLQIVAGTGLGIEEARIGHCFLFSAAGMYLIALYAGGLYWDYRA